MIVDGYVRVSQVRGRAGDSFIAPAAQRDQIEAWATLHGAVLAQIHEELDESGARADRPLLEAALTRIEAGDSEGLVVARLDRFGRSLIDALAAVERIEKAGGTFVSVSDGLDLRTDTGRLVLRIMLSMAEYELDRIRGTWDTARAKAIERGVSSSQRRRMYHSIMPTRLSHCATSGVVVACRLRDAGKRGLGSSALGGRGRCRRSQRCRCLGGRSR